MASAGPVNGSPARRGGSPSGAKKPLDDTTLAPKRLTPIVPRALGWLKRNGVRLNRPFRFSLLFEHDLFRKPVSTFRDHALKRNGARFFGFPMPADGVNKKDVRKVVLAYSGGLDTSIILKWLQTTYGCEVVTFTADLGQGDQLEPARQKALALGIKPENIFIEDLREEFVRDYVFPMFRANAVYEGQYLLGTSIARPLIAKKQIEIAEKLGADAVSHGATG